MPNRTETEDPRLRMMDALLGSPHGALSRVGQLHAEVLEADPQFYGCIAAWYHQRGVIRDQRLLFAAHLALSPEEAHRRAGVVLLQGLRTYEVARLVRYLKETHRLPRRTRSAVRCWIQRREADPAWFDEVALRDRRNLKYLYATLRLRPHPRARAILFERRLPPDSRLAVVRRLSRVDDPVQAARLIVEHRIFSSTAVGAVRRLDPPVLAALIEVMSPQQLLNGLAALRRRGALDHPELRRLVQARLERAHHESRVQDARTLQAARAVAGDREIGAQLGRIGASRLQARGRIRRPTAIFVDKSGSMEAALELGAHVATLCSTVADAELWTYAFDAVGRRVAGPADRDSLTSWRRCFGRLRANGATSIGAPFVNLWRDGARVEQVVVITDGEENTPPFFVDALRDYEAQVGVRCRVTAVFVNERATGQTVLEQALRRARVEYSAYRFDGDLYSLPNLVAYLSWPRRAELCAEILETPLPTYDDLQRLPPGFDPRTCELI